MASKKKPSAKQRHRRLDQFLKPFRVTKGRGFRLSQIKPDDSRGVKSKEEAKEYLQQGISRLAAIGIIDDAKPLQIQDQ